VKTIPFKGMSRVTITFGSMKFRGISSIEVSKQVNAVPHYGHSAGQTWVKNPSHWDFSIELYDPKEIAFISEEFHSRGFSPFKVEAILNGEKMSAEVYAYKFKVDSLASGVIKAILDGQAEKVTIGDDLYTPEKVVFT
jgi:hypothetical protein